MSISTKVVLATIAVLLQAGAGNASDPAKKKVDGEAWVLAHAVYTEAHERPKGMDAVTYAILQRVESGRYGRTIHSTVHWKHQFAGPKKMKPWTLRSRSVQARWSRTLVYANNVVSKWRAGKMPVSPTIYTKFKGCMNFDNVPRKDLGRFCGKVDGNYFYRP